MSMADWFARNFGPNICPDCGGASGHYHDCPQSLQIDLSKPPKPRLVSITKAPSREAFAVWRDDPVTQFVFMALRNKQSDCYDAWHQLSWNGGIADQSRLNELRTQADTFAAPEECSYEDCCRALGVDPEPEPDAA